MGKEKNKLFANITEFAETCLRVLRSDRDVIVAVAGFTGEGKTTFTHQFLKEYSKISGTYWGFDRMTWDRSELLKWVDGKKGSEKDTETGLKPGQLPEYSPISPDELFHMFYSRTWYEQEQISAIATFNMARDRHLLICGNIPHLWDLDRALLSRLRFYVYIPMRGIAWIFQQDDNPFSKDPWNVTSNAKAFREKKRPYGLPNFICELKFSDMTPEEKETYYMIRNEKRVKALQKPIQNRERYKDIKDMRDEILRSWHTDRVYLSKTLSKLPKEIREKLKPWLKPPTYKDYSEILGISQTAIQYSLKGRTKTH